MSLFTNIYLAFSKRRFSKTFKPLGIEIKRNFLVSAPSNTNDFLKYLPYIAALKKFGNIVMLTPKNLEMICQHIKPKKFENIYYNQPAIVLSKDHNGLKSILEKRKFHFLIELEKPANISLPYLANIEKRICFYDPKKFPYYNIMLKDNINSLGDFFDVKNVDTKGIFGFSKHNAHSILKKYNKKTPLLIVNGADIQDWHGDKIIIGQDIAANNPDVYELIYASAAYCGKDDGLHLFARIFEKEIIG